MVEDATSDMGRPAATEEPWREPGTVPLRPIVIVGAILLVIAIGYLSYSCVHSARTVGSFSAPVSRYPAGSITYLASGRTYLIRRDDGSFIALSEIEADAADRLAVCVIRYRADLNATDQIGVFRDDCQGTLFNREGSAIESSAPPMQRHPAGSAGDEVTVQLRACVAGDGSGIPERCRE